MNKLFLCLSVMNHQDFAPQKTILNEMFRARTSENASELILLPRSGSDRVYFRLKGGDHSAIGAYNPDRRENDAFVAFARHFHDRGVPVPEIYEYRPEDSLYLQEDLGDETLLQRLNLLRKGTEFPPEAVKLYQSALSALAHLQTRGAEGLDYNLCYPRAAFDKQSMLWDLSYFKYYFLKLARIPFDEQALEDDFHRFADYLLSTDSDYFMFRDFQARNIMLRGDEPYFIDFQGGRKGALQYDLASLLYQAKAAIPHQQRAELLEHYLDALEKLVPVDRIEFKNAYKGYVLIRTIQVLGAYGFRGFFERKSHFLESIPYALKNLQWILDHAMPPLEIPELRRVLESLASAEALQEFTQKRGGQSKLTVRIQSFSYKTGLPQDPSGNGGGFVFDCRSLNNPGRYQPYKKLTGRDQPVIDFLKQNSRIDSFLRDVFSIVEPAVRRYMEREFTSLMVSFGCTGGQHRSVYSADQLAAHLEKKYPLTVVVEHIQQEKKNWINE